MKVTLTEEPIAGSYVVAEQREDGTLVLQPEPPIAAAHRRTGTQPMSAEEFEEHIGQHVLPPDGEG